jgi:hypothetical protein
MSLIKCVKLAFEISEVKKTGQPSSGVNNNKAPSKMEAFTSVIPAPFKMDGTDTRGRVEGWVSRR